MIERRRMPIPQAPSRWKPSSSGPRCTVTRAMAWSAARSAGLRQAVDLLLEGDDLGPRLLEGGHQPFVFVGQPADLTLRPRQPLFELPDMTRALGQPPPHHGEFLLKERDLV